MGIEIGNSEQGLSKKINTSLGATKEIIDWIDDQIKLGRFVSRTHCLEYMVYKYQLWERWGKEFNVLPVIKYYSNYNEDEKRIKISISPDVKILKWMDGQIATMIFLNKSHLFEELVARTQVWDSYQHKEVRPLVGRFFRPWK